MEFIEIERENAEKVREIVETPLGKQGVAEVGFHIRETMETVGKQYVLRRRKTCCNIPYKTCGIH